MISDRTARIINFLPESLVSAISKFIIDGYLKKYANIKIINKEYLERIQGPVIYICNHLSNSDGLILNKILKDVTFVAGVKLSKNDLTSLGMSIIKTIPINPSSPDKSAISNVIKHLRSGNSICIFPEGTRSRVGSMIKGKKGILLIQKLSKAPMVPIGITGTEKLLAINEDMGKEKFNYADVSITIGESFYIPERELDEAKEAYEERAINYVMRQIAQLLPEKYQGVYRGK